MPLSHAGEKLPDLPTDALLVGADAADREEALRPGVLRRQVLRHEHERADEPHRPLTRRRYRRQRGDPAVEEDVAQQRLGAVVGGVAERQHGALLLGGDPVEQAPAVAAAHVAAVDDPAVHQPEGGEVLLQHPRNAQAPNLPLNLPNGNLEFTLLDRHRHQVVAKGRPPPVRRQGVQETEAVLAARDAHRDPVARAQHLELAHRPADRVQDPALDFVSFHRLPSQRPVNLGGRFSLKACTPSR